MWEDGPQSEEEGWELEEAHATTPDLQGEREEREVELDHTQLNDDDIITWYVTLKGTSCLLQIFSRVRGNLFCHFSHL